MPMFLEIDGSTLRPPCRLMAPKGRMAMAGHITLRTWLDENKQEAIFQIDERETPLAHVKLELPEFTDVVRRLGELRTGFAEEVPMDIDIGTRTSAIADPVWKIMTGVPGLPPEAVLLLFRHPGYGWLSFALPDHEAKAMAAALSASTGQRQSL